MSDDKQYENPSHFSHDVRKFDYANADVYYENENVWTTEIGIGRIFGIDRSVVNRHINNIIKDGISIKTRVFDRCALGDIYKSEKKYYGVLPARVPKYYDFGTILLVGMRTNSPAAMQFQMWVAELIKRELHQEIRRSYDDDRRLERQASKCMRKQLNRAFQRSLPSAGKNDYIREAMAINTHVAGKHVKNARSGESTADLYNRDGLLKLNTTLNYDEALLAAGMTDFETRHTLLSKMVTENFPSLLGQSVFTQFDQISDAQQRLLC